ncbi:carbohydrate kinase [Coprinopsis marcescibilis]|uniref:Gluconokinase n=1 Tax=Coprinopsis marcescibilis TaxID=230819 RepID=A0A5C3KN85_COPMA|nr:carbohydrate kinase [Coprinopsis marcescibilis]
MFKIINALILKGVSGTGKSTLGSALSKELRIPFVEGDDLHPKSNVDKMSAGIPLNDTDREPWLKLIRATAEQLIVEQQNQKTLEEADEDNLRGVVVGCSALKRYYRDILRGKENAASDKASLPEELKPNLENIPTFFVFIDGPQPLLYDRMEKRPGHFMKASMLDSQLATLEKPIGEEGVVVVSLEDSTDIQVLEAKERLITLI